MSLFNEASTGAMGMPPIRPGTPAQPSMADYLKNGTLGFGMPSALQQPATDPWALPGTAPAPTASPVAPDVGGATSLTGQMPAQLPAGTPAPQIAAPQPVGDQTGAVTPGFTNMTPAVSPLPVQQPQGIITSATPFAPIEQAAAKPATAAPATSPVAPTATGDQAQPTSLLNNPWAKPTQAKPATSPGMSGVLRGGTFGA